MEIEVTYRVVTPLFCAGADRRQAEVRLPSFKGVLRFWWRALAWSRYGGDLQKIREQEDALFGSSGGGQSRVSMRLLLTSAPPVVRESEVLTIPHASGRVVGEGARYLGYGVMAAFGNRKRGTRDGELARPCLRAPFDFSVHMRLRQNGLCAKEREEQLTSLQGALIGLGLLGGMGAKSRKGYGSLVIRSLLVDGASQWVLPRSVHDLRRCVTTLRRNCGGTEQPEYTALSGNTRHVLVTADRQEALEMLDLVGRELMRYRSWGHRGKVLDQQSEENFRDDHDLMKGHRRNRHPRRIAFGLPHNYGKGRHEQVEPFDPHLDRRASPLFIHMHECDDAPVAVLSFLPARFLPKGRSDISVGGSRVQQQPEADLYRPVHGFLDRLLDQGQRKEEFTDAVEVAP